MNNFCSKILPTIIVVATFFTLDFLTAVKYMSYETDWASQVSSNVWVFFFTDNFSDFFESNSHLKQNSHKLYSPQNAFRILSFLKTSIVTIMVQAISSPASFTAIASIWSPWLHVPSPSIYSSHNSPNSSKVFPSHSEQKRSHNIWRPNGICPLHYPFSQLQLLPRSSLLLLECNVIPPDSLKAYSLTSNINFWVNFPYLKLQPKTLPMPFPAIFFTWALTRHLPILCYYCFLKSQGLWIPRVGNYVCFVSCISHLNIVRSLTNIQSVSTLCVLPGSFYYFCI